MPDLAVQRGKFLLIVTLATMLTNALPHAATGQEAGSASDERIEEIVVTGQAVQDLDLDIVNTTGSRLGLTSFQLPASIDIIDSGTMTMRGFKTVTEAAESLPGVLSGDAPGEPSSFSMRGFQQNQITELRDGLRAGPHNMTMRPQNTFNLERIEILKGPSSVLYGEGAVAGTINMVTKKPVLNQETEIEILALYGRYNSWDIGLGIGAPWNDKAAYRLDIDSSASGGWVDRADSRSTNVTGSVLLAITDDFDLMVTGDYLDDDLPSYWGTPLVTEAFAGRHAMTNVISSTEDMAIDDRTPFINYNVADHVSESNHFWGRLIADWRLNADITFRNQFYHFTADRSWINAEKYTFNPVTEAIDRDRFFVLHDQELYGGRIDLEVHHDLGTLANTVVVGIDYSDLDFVRSRGFPDGDSVNVLNPVPGLFGPLERRVSPTKMETLAVLFEDHLKLSDTLSVIGGLRYDSIELVRENYDVNGNFDPTTSFRDSYGPLSWRLGTVYQLTPKTTIYGQYSVARDPPSSSSLFLVNAGRNFDLSEAHQWEVGYKAQFEDRASGKLMEVTFAIYDIDRDDILTQISPIEVSNIGNQKSQGAELSVAADATNRWRVGGNAAYIDSEYGLFFDPDFGIEASGNRPPNVPRWAINVWSSVSNVAGLPLELGGGARYISDRYANSSNTVKLLNYTLVDTFAAYTIDNSRIMVRVRNLTDEEYSPWADIYYPNQIVLGMPRTYEVSLFMEF